MRSLMLSALLATLVAAAPSRTQGGAEAAIDKAVAAYNKVKTARASFEQTLTNPLTGTTVISRGELQQKQPGRLSVRFTDPKGDVIVADGRAVWIYLPSTNPGQVIKMSRGQGDAGFVDPAAAFLSAPRDKYTLADAGVETLDGRSTRAVTLVPRSEAPFSRGTVWIDEVSGTLRQFEIVGANGLVRRVHLTKVRLNVPVDRAAFTFIPPPGVRVFDQSAAMGDAS